MTIPPPDTNIDKIQPINYVINRIDLGKKTHEITMEDAQSSLDNIVARYNEENFKKDRLNK